MTTTTKIFVILVCLFAFIFTPLAISFAARTYNWRELANGYRDRLEIAYATERSAMAIAASEIERYKSLRDREHERFLALQQEVNGLGQKLAELTTERDQLARSQESWQTSAQLLTAEMTVKTAHNKELADAKNAALEREQELRARNLQLNDRVKELSAKLVVVTQQLNQKLQEITAYREENEQLRSAGGLGRAGGPITAVPTPSAQPASPATSSPIVGSVTSVSGKLATLDVGSAAGIREGSKMVITRDNSWVCDLVITDQVTPTEAVGEVRLKAENMEIRAGDTVQDEQSFSRS